MKWSISVVLLSVALIAAALGKSTTVSPSNSRYSPSFTSLSRSSSLQPPTPAPTTRPPTQLPTAIPFNVSQFYPVGPKVLAPGLTNSPSNAPVASPSTDAPSSSPLIGIVNSTNSLQSVVLNSMANQVDFYFTSFNEFGAVEFIQQISEMLSKWILSSDTTYDTQLINATAARSVIQLWRTMQVLGANASASPASIAAALATYPDVAVAYSPEMIARRIVPLRTLRNPTTDGYLSVVSPPAAPVVYRSGGHRAARKRPPQIGLESGSLVLVTLVLLASNASSGMPISINTSTSLSQAQGKVFPFPRPVANAVTSPTMETSLLCICLAGMFSQWFDSPRSPIHALSNAGEWRLSSLVRVECPLTIKLNAFPGEVVVGVDWLWVAFLCLAAVCITITIAVMIKSRSDVTIDIDKATEKEYERQQQQHAANKAAAAVMGTAKTSASGASSSQFEFHHADDDEEMDELDRERQRIVEARQRDRIRMLVRQAVTGDATIYGASEQEKEIVGAILRNPRFDGGRVDLKDVSTVEEFISNDRLFRLPPPRQVQSDEGLASHPSWFRFGGKKDVAGGKVTSVSFAADIDERGARMVSGIDNSALTADDLQQTSTIDAQFDAVGQAGELGEEVDDIPRDPERDRLLPMLPPDVAVAAVVDAFRMEQEKRSVSEGRDEVSLAEHQNALATDAALRGANRRSHQLNKKPTGVKERLMKILEAEDEFD